MIFDLSESLLLKDLYDPMNPDKDTITVRHNFNLKEHEEELLNHLRPLLGQFTNKRFNIQENIFVQKMNNILYLLGYETFQLVPDISRYLEKISGN